MWFEEWDLEGAKSIQKQMPKRIWGSSADTARPAHSSHPWVVGNEIRRRSPM